MSTESDRQSKMRLAYTRACVAWPRASLVPIYEAAAEIFSDVSGEELGYSIAINKLVGGAVLELRNEKAAKEYVATLPVADKRPLLSFLVGLDDASMRRVYQKSLTGNYEQARADRDVSLRSRRNLLANSLAEKVAEEAEKTRCRT